MIDREVNRFEIETERLRLRTFEPYDLEPLHRLWNDRDVMMFIRPGWAPSREDVETYFETIKKRWGENGYSHFAVTLKDKDELIGYCGFQALKDAPDVELLYGIEKSYWRNGYITEAARACLRFAFENTKLDRIVALANPMNKGSWRVMEKVGMKYEKMMKEDNEILVCFAITREEYDQSIERDPSRTS